MSKVKTPQRLRMDKSKYYSSVHGERATDDAHAKVHFYQDGLPFDGEGLLLVDLVPEDKKTLVERRIAKLNGKTPVPQAAPEPDPDDEDENENDDETNSQPEPPLSADEVNIESWLRGEAKYPWFSLVAAIRARFNKQVNNTTDAVTFLVEDEKVISPAQLAEYLKANYVPSKV